MAGSTAKPGTIGFIGLGSMGSAVVRSLMGAGYEVVGWNRDPAKAERVEADGMVRAASPREVAERAEIVFSMVTDGKAVEAIVTGGDGVAAGIRSGGLFADMSTIAPAKSAELAALIAERGAEMLDAPVSGSVETLEQGNLAVMVGGSQEAFDRLEPVLLDIGPKVTRIGEQSLALQAKLAINLALVVQVIGFCEGVALAERGGVDREVAVNAMLRSVVASPVLGYRGPFILEGRMPEDAWADVDLQQKDLMLALDLGRTSGVPLPVTAAANEMLNAARGLGIGDKDFVVTFEAYRKLAGMAD
ncbi:NAD(P)-dependent oxidoreductase [Thermoleophilia bacterium SCSIO 60948]|nr:NAD(P)-dependent oxidoreductase [Thermoleophilia bacterium SCSIO 60948]